METTISTYEQQAIDFLNKTNCTIEIKFLKHGKHFQDDKEERDIYEITLKRGGRSYTFNFGQSIVNSGFYVMLGKQRINLDRKLIGDSAIHGKIKMNYNYDYMQGRDKIFYPKAPTAYDILACVTKHEVGTFEDFCSEFGYDTDSRKAEKTYQAVKEEYLNISRLFNEDELAELQEIN
jgi:hypothetical protein